jgi:hypothetical protein
MILCFTLYLYFEGLQCDEELRSFFWGDEFDSLADSYTVRQLELPITTFYADDKEEEMFQQAIKTIYPAGYDPELAVSNVILATTNVEVDQWNEIIADMNPHPEVTLTGKSSFTQIDDNHGHIKSMLSDEVLERYSLPTVPAHTLKLKVDDICIILRNISTQDGITNNTRVRIREIRPNSIVVTTISENPINIVLPRIKFQFKIQYGNSFEMTRVQFPLRRAFALTFNKSQGQTLKRVLLDLRSDVFSHGFLYVGMSRVQRFDDIFILTNRSNRTFSPDEKKFPIVLNIVFKEALGY